MKPRFKIIFIDGVLLCLPGNYEAMEYWEKWAFNRPEHERNVFKNNISRIPSTIYWGN